MAKKARRKRKFRKYLRGSIEQDNALSTLAANTLIAFDNADVVTEKAWLSSVVARWSLSSFTPIANAGPILVGIAHSDYTDSEIEDWLESQTSWKQGNLVRTREVGRRLIKIVGVFDTQGASDAIAWMALRDGEPIKTKCGWQLVTGQTVKFWAYNKGTAALSSTNPIVGVSGHANLWPN